MKTNGQLFLFVAVILALLLAACAAPATSTPTVEVPTDFPSATLMVTETATLQMDTATPVPTPTTETATPTATGQAGTVPVQLICWFCVEQVPHVMVAMPQSATFEVVASSSGVTCSAVEMVENTQLVLCQGPRQAGSIPFDLNVCSNGNCSERHVTAVDCSATAVPTETLTATPSATETGTPAVGAPTQTPTQAGGNVATATPTRSVDIIRTSTPEGLTSTPTP